jgi:hypothetical protein
MKRLVQNQVMAIHQAVTETFGANTHVEDVTLAASLDSLNRLKQLDWLLNEEEWVIPIPASTVVPLETKHIYSIPVPPPMKDLRIA